LSDGNRCFFNLKPNPYKQGTTQKKGDSQMKKLMSILVVMALLSVVGTSFAASTNLTVADVRQAVAATAEPAPYNDGADTIVQGVYIEAIPDRNNAAPVYACTDKNGWLVSGPTKASPSRLAATTMVPEGKNYRAIGMAGKRFHPCQTDTPTAKGAEHVRWAQIQDAVDDYKTTAWIDRSAGDNKPCIKVK
jgi:hypothetical protein